MTIACYTSRYEVSENILSTQQIDKEYENMARFDKFIWKFSS